MIESQIQYVIFEWIYTKFCFCYHHVLSGTQLSYWSLGTAFVAFSNNQYPSSSILHQFLMSHKQDVPQYGKCPSRGAYRSTYKCELLLLEWKIKQSKWMCRELFSARQATCGKAAYFWLPISDFTVYGKDNRVPFGVCSVNEIYFDFGLRSVWETVMLELAT
jgi:hypothetical protein